MELIVTRCVTVINLDGFKRELGKFMGDRSISGCTNHECYVLSLGSAAIGSEYHLRTVGEVCAFLSCERTFQRQSVSQCGKQSSE